MTGRTAARAVVAGLVGLAVGGTALAGRGHSGHSGGGRSGHFTGSGNFHHFHHGGHFHHRVFIGATAPFYYPLPYYDPYTYYAPYYYPPTVIAPPPAQYVAPYPAQSAPQAAYWYYCPESGAYYPYVQQCPSGWRQVAPQPPS